MPTCHAVGCVARLVHVADSHGSGLATTKVLCVAIHVCVCVFVTYTHAYRSATNEPLTSIYHAYLYPCIYFRHHCRQLPNEINALPQIVAH